MRCGDVEQRALRALGRETWQIAGGGTDGALVLAGSDGRRIVTNEGVIRRLAAEGLVRRERDRIRATGAGPGDPLRGRHMQLETREIETPAGRATAVVNLSESPLALLARRRGRDGKAYLEACEVEAGERLRSDFTRAQMMPRQGVDWAQPIAGGRRAGAAADLSDGAIAAKMRVERAIHGVGPELCGVLIDVCCFLKGLETVEYERGWPARSAKLMLKTALGALSRHYDPRPSARETRPQTRSWGAEGYRPVLRP